MNSRYDAVGEDLVSDALITKLQERDIPLSTMPIRNGVSVDKISSLIEQGYISLGTGFYRDAEHHVWRIEKEGDNYLLVRADEIFNSIPEQEKLSQFKHTSGISGGASIEEVDIDRVALIKAVLKERLIKTYEATPEMIDRVASEHEVELNSKEIKVIADTYRYVSDRRYERPNKDWKVPVDNRYS